MCICANQYILTDFFNVKILKFFTMKKIYIIAASLFLGANINAQLTVDFESFTLSTESFDNGSAGGGDFIMGQNSDVILSNVFDPSFSSWNGFSISNMTDITSAGWGNEFSSFVGSGSNASSNYAMFYPEGSIMANASNLVFDSIKITNGTYAAISMRDGDAFGKQFGSFTDASGADDGTNGEDFFKVWIIVENFQGTEKDSTEFYLADYRFADNSLDYIVDEWTNVDLTAFSFAVSKLNFRFVSSDNGAGWINTPTYFALDDISYEYYLGLDEVQVLSINAYPNPVNDVLSIQGEQGILSLTNVNGELLLTKSHINTTQIDMTLFANGVYFLKLENDLGTVIQKIIK